MLDKNKLPDVFHVQFSEAAELQRLIDISRGILDFGGWIEPEKYHYPDKILFVDNICDCWDDGGIELDFADLVEAFTIIDFVNPK